jgi:tRNA threonylcarbamoyladenosine biosynthesis protein TsaE
METTTHSLDEFNAEAARFVRGLHPRANSATVVALSGNLGAGKTTWVQAIARELGVEEQVNSPTFVIEKIYQLSEGNPPAGGFERLVHIDAYRLNGAQEIGVLGWPELVATPSNLVLIEWPENVSGAMPREAIHISLSGGGDERHIIYGEN